jgi:prephenate dehydrogenase
MAGSEKTGMENGRAELFHGAACLVTPLADTPEGEIERVVQLWSELGMLVTTLSPERHDEIVAHVSHLPHLLASALCGFLINRPEEWKAFAGNGLRDTTRIAAGDPVLWRSIVQQNRDEILRALVGFEEELQRFRAAIANEEDFRLQHLLEVGKTWRDRLPSPK